MISLKLNEYLNKGYFLIREQQKEIKAISWISFFWAQASLMVFAILPVFLSEELGISHTQIGIIEGLAIGASFATKVLAGILSDFFRRRKPFILLGSILSILSKPLFALSSTLSFVFLARFVDRISKGIRSAPTDAFLADISPQKNYASTFAQRQSLYTFGAVFGALCAMIILAFDSTLFRLVFWCAAIPNLLAIAIFVYYLNISSESILKKNINYNFDFLQLKSLPPFFWKFLGVLSFLMVARFSEAFLSLYAKQFGCPHSCLPLIIIVMDIFHALVAAYSGTLSKKYSSKKVLLFGLFLLIFNNYWFYQASSLSDVFWGVSFIGIHMGLTQGLIRSIIANHVPESLRGSSFAIFYLVSGLCIIIGNIIAGSLSDKWGLKYIFLSGGIFSLFATVILSYLVLKENYMVKNNKTKNTRGTIAII